MADNEDALAVAAILTGARWCYSHSLFCSGTFCSVCLFVRNRILRVVPFAFLHDGVPHWTDERNACLQFFFVVGSLLLLLLCLATEPSITQLTRRRRISTTQYLFIDFSGAWSEKQDERKQARFLPCSSDNTYERVEASTVQTGHAFLTGERIGAIYLSVVLLKSVIYKASPTCFDLSCKIMQYHKVHKNEVVEFESYSLINFSRVLTGILT